MDEAEASFEYAGLRERFVVALVSDASFILVAWGSVVVIVVVSVIAVGVAAAPYCTADCPEPTGVLAVLDRLAGSALIPAFTLPLWFPWLYFVRSTSTQGQTKGKEKRGIKVVRSDGRLPGFGHVVLRETIKLAPFWLGFGLSWVTKEPRLLGLTGVLLLLNFLPIAGDPKRQGWHDKIAGTYVVRALVPAEEAPL
jgi:uncharacterized RDD family membrane protein YckC